MGDDIFFVHLPPCSDQLVAEGPNRPDVVGDVGTALLQNGVGDSGVSGVSTSMRGNHALQHVLKLCRGVAGCNLDGHLTSKRHQKIGEDLLISRIPGLKDRVCFLRRGLVIRRGHINFPLWRRLVDVEVPLHLRSPNGGEQRRPPQRLIALGALLGGGMNKWRGWEET